MKAKEIGVDLETCDFGGDSPPWTATPAAIVRRIERICGCSSKPPNLCGNSEVLLHSIESSYVHNCVLYIHDFEYEKGGIPCLP